MSNLERTFDMIHGYAWCLDCQWETSSYKNAQAIAAKHAKDHAHSVEGEVGYAFTYSGKKP